LIRAASGPANKPERKMAEGNIAADQLRLFIERIERLEEEKKGIADDIRDVYSEAKGQGYDAKIMRQIVRLRKMTNDDRQEMEAILDTYKAALGLG
jgi:uncharacterized protein (UPF0335 family)